MNSCISLWFLCLQIHSQFPLSFEFNQFYLRFLAYHYVSNRFRTFMLDNEAERMEAGWLMEEGGARRRSLDSESGDSSNGDAGGSPSQSRGAGGAARQGSGMSIWDYIHIYHQRSPLFYNFMYTPPQDQCDEVSEYQKYIHFSWIHLCGS
jgi:myotubularin-related protein 5/13